MTTALLLSAFAMGFLGSPHCMGMCGGIVTAFGISMQRLSPQKRNLLIITYHLGRMLSYMSLGLIAAVFGETLLAPLMTGNALPRIVLGLAIIFAALLMLGAPFLNRLEKVGLGLWHRLSFLRQKVLPIDSPSKALGAGLLWGFLPCGLVYGALVVAMSAAATEQRLGVGVLFMLFFGLGTMPMLVMTGATLSWLQQKVKALNLRQLSGGILLISGLFAMLSPAMHLMRGHHGSTDGHKPSQISHASHVQTPHTQTEHPNHHSPKSEAAEDSGHTHHDSHH